MINSTFQVFAVQLENTIEVQVVFPGECHKTFTFKNKAELIRKTEDLFDLAHATDGEDSTSFKDEALALVAAFEQLTVGGK